jgi:hypothetical protein
VSDPVFPMPTERVVATVAELARLQDRAYLADLLAAADARIEATDWDRGVDYYTLFLVVPLPIYATIEPKLGEVEEVLLGKVKKVTRDIGSNELARVTVLPALQEPAADIVRPVSDVDEKRIWDPGMFRLFISHVAIHKVAVSNLKTQLGYLGISGFVAHEDIEPTREWQDEIVLALRSMQAMAVLLTPEFHPSPWTDQEVGAAVVRGVTIVPVRLGSDPYGFMARHQALSGTLQPAKDLAMAVAMSLTKNPLTSVPMREALVVAIESASSFVASIAASKLLVELPDLAQSQLHRIEAALRDNSQVSDAFGVGARIRRLLAANGIQLSEDSDA